MSMKLGEKIRCLREDADMNQTALGKATGMSQRKISYIECGACEPSVEDIKVLCRVFNVSADYLLGLPKDMPFPKER